MMVKLERSEHPEELEDVASSPVPMKKGVSEEEEAEIKATKEHAIADTTGDPKAKKKHHHHHSHRHKGQHHDHHKKRDPMGESSNGNHRTRKSHGERRHTRSISPNQGRNRSISPRPKLERSDGTQMKGGHLEKQGSERHSNLSPVPKLERGRSGGDHLKRGHLKNQDSGRHRSLSPKPIRLKRPSIEEVHTIKRESERHKSKPIAFDWSRSPSPNSRMEGTKTDERQVKGSSTRHLLHLKTRESGRHTSKPGLEKTSANESKDHEPISLSKPKSPVQQPTLQRSTTLEGHNKQRAERHHHRHSSRHSDVTNHRHSRSPNRLNRTETDKKRLSEAAAMPGPAANKLERGASESQVTAESKRPNRKIRHMHSDGCELTEASDEDCHHHHHHGQSLHKCRSRRHRHHHASSVLHNQLEHSVEHHCLAPDEESEHHHKCPEMDHFPEEEDECSCHDAPSRRAGNGMSNILSLPLTAASKAPKVVTNTAVVAAKTTVAATTATAAVVGSGARGTANMAGKVFTGAANAALNLVPFSKTDSQRELCYSHFDDPASEEYHLRTTTLGAKKEIHHSWPSG